MLTPTHGTDRHQLGLAPPQATLWSLLCCHPWETAFLLLLFPSLQSARAATGLPRSAGKPNPAELMATASAEPGQEPTSQGKIPCPSVQLHSSALAHPAQLCLVQWDPFWSQTHPSYKRCFPRKIHTLKQRWDKKKYKPQNEFS